MSSPESSLNPAHRKDSNSFPQEYKGLLPSRDDPTSPPLGGRATEATAAPANVEGSSSLFGDKQSELSGQSQITQATGQGASLPDPHAPMAPGASDAPFAYQRAPSQESQSKPPVVPAKTAFDDFDDEFADLSEAKEADEKGDEEFPSHKGGGFEEFNPTFDSPASTRTANAFQHGPNNNLGGGGNSFHNFESSLSSAQASNPTTTAAPAAASHDWDAIFAGLDTPPQHNGVQFDAESGKGLGSTPAPPPQNGKAENPQLARTLSAGTEHDDPIVKRLTGMGFSRNASVAALERYDYNLDEVRALFLILRYDEDEN